MTTVDELIALDAHDVDDTLRPFVGMIGSRIDDWLSGNAGRDVAGDTITGEQQAAIYQAVIDMAEEAWFPTGGGSYDTDHDHLIDTLDAAIATVLAP